MRGVAIGAHAAGVRAGVAVEDGLVVLRGASGSTSRPSHSAMKLTSSPRRNSSITSGPLSVASACSASARSWATTTPFPAASPSTFSTTGNPKRSSACRASVCVVGGDELGRGDSTLHKKVLCKTLTAFELRGRRGRPDEPAVHLRETHPQLPQPAGPPAPPPSGPRRALRPSPDSLRAWRDPRPGCKLPNLAMPGLPGVANTC